MKNARPDPTCHDSDEKETHGDNITEGLPSTLKAAQVGIWRVITERNPDTPLHRDKTPPKTSLEDATELVSRSWSQFYDDPITAISTLMQRTRVKVERTHIPRLVTDIYLLDPGRFGIMALSFSLTGAESALLLWLNNRVMTLVRLYHI